MISRKVIASHPLLPRRFVPETVLYIIYFFFRETQLLEHRMLCTKIMPVGTGCSETLNGALEVRQGPQIPYVGLSLRARSYP